MTGSAAMKFESTSTSSDAPIVFQPNVSSHCCDRGRGFCAFSHFSVSSVLMLLALFPAGKHFNTEYTEKCENTEREFDIRCKTHGLQMPPPGRWSPQAPARKRWTQGPFRREDRKHHYNQGGKFRCATRPRKI